MGLLARLAWGRLRWWSWRTALTAGATGVVIGTLVALPFALSRGAPLTLMPMAWGIGGAMGGTAGLIAAVLGAVSATLISPRTGLGRRGAAVIGAIVCTVGSLIVLVAASDSGPDAGELPFVILVTAVAAVVGGVISPGTERRASEARPEEHPPSEP